MGYFSSGSEGYDYVETWCSRCLHNDDHHKPCVVWELHMLHNYDECNNDESMLHVLIPRDGCYNGQCKMFIDKSCYVRKY